MENVLVIACGATKNPTTGPVRALDLYAGRQFKLARRLVAEAEAQPVALAA